MKRITFPVALVALSLFGLLVAGCAVPAVAGGSPAAANSAALLAAQEANSETLPRTISVNGSGVASAAPDIAYITLGVETVNADPAQAVAENNAAMTAVIEAIKALGVAEADIQTVNYTMWIEQVVDRDGIPTGETKYHVSNQVRVKVTDFAKTGEVLQAALAAGANTVAGVEFAVSDPAALQQQARDQAVAAAQAKAAQLATGFKVTLGPVRNINEFSSVAQPMAMVADTGGGGPAPIAGGSFSVTVELQVVYDIAD